EKKLHLEELNTSVSKIILPIRVVVTSAESKMIKKRKEDKKIPYLEKPEMSIFMTTYPSEFSPS
ncbi:1047_t:CDS:1, partial [Racocetra fulgida]